MKIHPHDVLLQELAAGLAGEARTLKHLTGCAACRERIRFLLAHGTGLPGKTSKEVFPGSRWPAPDYGAVFDRAEEVLRVRRAALEKERAEAVRLLAELLGRTPEKREMLLRNHRRFQTWGLLELLAERSHEVRLHAPAQGEELGHLALVLADSLDMVYYGAERIEDLRARVWGQIANHRRAISDFLGAEEAFSKAFTHLQNGTADVMERAVLLDLRASLFRDQRRFAEAERLLERARRIFLQIGEKQRAGRSLVNLSTVYEHAVAPERAIQALSEALKLIDPERDPRLFLAARHNLITNLAEAGRFMEAHGLFIQSRPLYARFSDGWTQNRRRWIEGRIARGLGQSAEAESLLRAARDGFVVEGVAYDTALVSLDLAALYAEQGRAAELEHLAEETVPIFSSRQIHREALAALTLWYRAVRMRMASSELVNEVASYLKRSRYSPELRFGEAP
ncbi:MAG TPA: tetratricopeptide repeat protein [Thermoanaerobaculia bacterium]|nr:tetratricopeptide repeat protein [Thermoanaerobaculia bacterium]